MTISASFHQKTRCWRSGNTRGSPSPAYDRQGYVARYGHVTDEHCTWTGTPASRPSRRLQEFGVDTMFTLNGGHIWPLYEAARDQGVRVVDTRHEQSATFAAEAYAKLTRRPGVAALTAGPGITNGVSAMTSAWFNGSPLVVLGGRAPQRRWGAGSLQELDHVPILRVDHQVVGHRDGRGEGGDDGPRGRRHRRRRRTAGRCSSTSRSTCSARRRAKSRRPSRRAPRRRPDPDDVAASPRWSPPPSGRRSSSAATCTGPARGTSSRPPWSTCVSRASSTGSAAARLPADHELAFLRTRGVLKERADLVVVLGTPLDFRLGFGRFGSAEVAHVVDAESQRAAHVDVLTVAGDIAATLSGLAEHAGAGRPRAVDRRAARRRGRRARRRGPAARRRRRPDQADPRLRRAAPAPRPRRRGDLRRRRLRVLRRQVRRGVRARLLARHRTVRLPRQRAGLLDRRPGRLAPTPRSSTLLGDGAAGFSLMDADSLVRHGLPVVMIVGNNGMWGLEKHPMQAVYGWDVACDLQPGCRYDEVVRALGGAGELVTEPDELGPALDRAFAVRRALPGQRRHRPRRRLPAVLEPRVDLSTCLPTGR